MDAVTLNYILGAIAIAGIVSEALSNIPAIKANGIFQAVKALIDLLKNKKTNSEV